MFTLITELYIVQVSDVVNGKLFFVLCSSGDAFKF